jgi:hypothetical protein
MYTICFYFIVTMFTTIGFGAWFPPPHTVRSQPQGGLGPPPPPRPLVPSPLHVRLDCFPTRSITAAVCCAALAPLDDIVCCTRESTPRGAIGHHCTRNPALFRSAQYSAPAKACAFVVIPQY